MRSARPVFVVGVLMIGLFASAPIALAKPRTPRARIVIRHVAQPEGETVTKSLGEDRKPEPLEPMMLGRREVALELEAPNRVIATVKGKEIWHRDIDWLESSSVVFAHRSDWTVALGTPSWDEPAFIEIATGGAIAYGEPAIAPNGRWALVVPWFDFGEKCYRRLAWFERVTLTGRARARRVHAIPMRKADLCPTPHSDDPGPSDDPVRFGVAFAPAGDRYAILRSDDYNGVIELFRSEDDMKLGGLAVTFGFDPDDAAFSSSGRYLVLGDDWFTLGD